VACVTEPSWVDNVAFHKAALVREVTKVVDPVLDALYFLLDLDVVLVVVIVTLVVRIGGVVALVAVGLQLSCPATSRVLSILSHHSQMQHSGDVVTVICRRTYSAS